MATFRGKLLMGKLLLKFMPKKGDGKGANFGGFELTDDLMKMMGGFTFLRLSGMIGMMGVNLTREQLLSINTKLNRIKKKSK